MKRRALVHDVAQVVATVLAAVAALALIIGALAPRDTVLQPCATEDSVSCHWDAQQQGNGAGVSFDVDAEGHVTLTP